jgi:hypothetical protein
MPHDGPVELVRQCPDMAVDFVRAVGGIKLPSEVTAELAPTDMSAAVPVQFLADMVVLISSAKTGKPVLAVVIEPQLRDRETKRYSWPVYVTSARRVSKCPRAVLVVLCPDPAEAARCRRIIRTGHPGFDLAPIVIDSGTAPDASGRDGAGGSTGPYLTVFAASMGAIDMATEPGAQMVLGAIKDTGANDADRFRMTTVILKMASDAARHILEKMMKTKGDEKTFIERMVDEGEAKGEAKGKAEAVLKLLDRRGLAPSEDQRRKVTSCSDTAQLDVWFDRAITAATADEVFTD